MISSLSIALKIPEQISFSHEIQLNLIVTLRDRSRDRARGCARSCARSCARGCVCDRDCVRGRARMHSRREIRRILFPSVYRSSVESINLSLSPENVRPAQTELLIPAPLGIALKCSSSLFWPWSQTELMQGSSD